MKNILYIHGAGATSLSFRFMISRFPNHAIHTVEIPVTEPISEAAQRIADRFGDIENLNIISHSLGGITAVNIAHLPNVQKIVTMSTPFGGHPAAALMAVWSQESLFKDLSPYSLTIRKLQKKWNLANKEHLAIVTNSGLPVLGYENDGVVTVKSQIALQGPTYETFKINHFEVLLADSVIQKIKSFIFEE